jgi:hypothetical protein
MTKTDTPDRRFGPGSAAVHSVTKYGDWNGNAARSEII